MGLCSCNDGYLNTGFGCTNNPSVTVGSFFFNRLKEDGTYNGIDFSADAVDGVIPDSVIQAKINDPNPLDRWYFVGYYENIEDVRAESLVQSFNSGNSARIKQGIRNFLGFLPKKAPAYVEPLLAMGCQDVAKMDVDDQGNLVGESLDDNFLRGIKIDQNTIDARYVKTTDAEISGVLHSYNYSQTVEDQNIKMITADAIGTDLKGVRGLLSATMTGAGTVTEATVNILVDYGTTIDDRTALKGLELADFTIQNVTQSAPVTIDSLDDSGQSAGDYVLAYSTGVTSGDSLRISVSKNGYEVNPITIVVP